MGASHSTQPRSVTIDNPTPPGAGIIDVSDEVVERLKKGLNQQAKENAKAKAVDAAPAPPPPPPKPEPRTVPIKTIPPPAQVPAVTPPAVSPRTQVIYQNPPTAIYTGGATMTALDVRRQKELELQQNDTIWRQRMTALEETLKKTDAVLESEYEASVENVRKRFLNAAPSHQLPPCQSLKAQLIACYRAHPGETLRCSEEVALFRDCINMQRIKKLETEPAKPATGKSTDSPVSAA